MAPPTVPAFHHRDGSGAAAAADIADPSCPSKGQALALRCVGQKMFSWLQSDSRFMPVRAFQHRDASCNPRYSNVVRPCPDLTVATLVSILGRPIGNSIAQLFCFKHSVIGKSPGGLGREVVAGESGLLQDFPPRRSSRQVPRRRPGASSPPMLNLPRRDLLGTRSCGLRSQRAHPELTCVC
jgi:hypothetical protein